MERPNPPQQYSRLSMKVELSSSATLAEILKAFDRIKEVYPNASPEECTLEDDGSCWDSDYTIEYALCFSRTIEDAHYQFELETYHKNMAAYLELERKIQHEHRMQCDIRYQNKQARKEYKTKSHEERLAKRLQATGLLFEEKQK